MGRYRVLARAIALAVAVLGLPVFGGPAPAPPRIRHAALELQATPGAGRRWTTPVLRAPVRFGLVGVSWKGLDERAPQVRTSPDGVSWTEWTTLDVRPDEGPDAASPEHHDTMASAPLWVKDADFVQVRWPPGAAAPAGAVAHLIDPGPNPARPTLPAAFAMTSQPGIITRAQWGANESLRRAPPRYAPTVQMAIVHHTDTGNTYRPQDSAAIVRSIYAYHVQVNGWDDIGYNFLVDRYGQIFEGRYGGMGQAVIGAHALGFNTGSTGVAVIGTFMTAGPPAVAMNALGALLAWKLDVHHVDPAGSTVMTSGGNERYREGTRVSLADISGHRDTGSTDCPGDLLYSQLPALRQRVAGIGLPKIYDPSEDRSAFTPNGDGRADTVTVTARPSGATKWTAEVLDAQGAVRLVRDFTGTNVQFTWDGRDSSGTMLGHGYYTVRLHAADDASTQAMPADVRVLLADWPDGSVIRSVGGYTVWKVQGNVLHPYVSPAEFLSTYGWQEVANVDPAAVDGYPGGSRPGFREGTLIRTPDGSVFLVSDGQRRHIATVDDFTRLGYRWDAIFDVSYDEASVHPIGAPIDSSTMLHPDGTLVRGSRAEVYWIQGGTRRWVPTSGVFETWFRWNEVVSLGDQELALYPPGAPLSFRDGSLVQVQGQAEVWVVSDGMRRHITSAETFGALGYSWSVVRAISDQETAFNPAGDPV